MQSPPRLTLAQVVLATIASMSPLHKAKPLTGEQFAYPGGSLARLQNYAFSCGLQLFSSVDPRPLG